MKSLLVSIPHSGEQVGEEADWLKNLPEATLMCDVDRFVDKLYQPVLNQLKIPHVITPWHRYMVDCNRWPEDVDCDSVEGAVHPAGTHPTGLHWRLTTTGFKLIKKPLAHSLHQKIVDKYYHPFFKKIDAIYQNFRQLDASNIYHLDLHTMPSMGTKAHRDPGCLRADIIIGTVKGTTAGEAWTKQVVSAYKAQALSVEVNFPYYGGSVVQKYGHPQKGVQAIMIEINRQLYMDEVSKQWIAEKAQALQLKLTKAISQIYNKINDG